MSSELSFGLCNGRIGQDAYNLIVGDAGAAAPTSGETASRAQEEPKAAISSRAVTATAQVQPAPIDTGSAAAAAAPLSTGGAVSETATAASSANKAAMSQVGEKR